MSKGTVARVSLSIELDGSIYFVALPNDRMMLLLKMAEGLSDNGKLPVIPAPADYKFQEIKK